MNQNVYDWLSQRNVTISEPKITDGDNVMRIIRGVVGMGVALLFAFGIAALFFVEVERDFATIGFSLLLTLAMFVGAGMQFLPGKRKKIWEERKFRLGSVQFDRTTLSEAAVAIENYDTQVAGFNIRTTTNYRNLVNRFGQDVADCLILTTAVKKYKSGWQLRNEVRKLLKKQSSF